MTYHQITFAERYTLGLLRQRGLAPAAIARVLGRHRSTIGREVRRNRAHSDATYRPQLADWYARGPPLPLPAQSAVHGGGLGAGPGARCGRTGVRSRWRAGSDASRAPGDQPRDDLPAHLGGQAGGRPPVPPPARSPETVPQALPVLRQPRSAGGETADHGAPRRRRRARSGRDIGRPIRCSATARRSRPAC